MKLSIIGVALLAAMAAACGGGGGGDGRPVDSAPPFLPNLLRYAGEPSSVETRDGIGGGARFYYPRGIANDAAGNLYVSEVSSIRKIAPDATVTTILGAGTQPHPEPLTDVAFHDSLGILAATHPTCLRCERTAGVIRIASSGTFTPILPSLLGNGGLQRLGENIAITPDVNGDILIASDFNAVLRLSLHGSLTKIVANDLGADLNAPSSIAVDSRGNIYVSDTGNHAVRKILPEGVMFTLAGGTQGGADGAGPAARFSWPAGIAVDSGGNVWVADTGNHAVRRITPEGKVTTVVGQLGKVGFAPGALPASLESPRDVTIVGHDLYILMDWGVAVVKDAAY